MTKYFDYSACTQIILMYVVKFDNTVGSLIFKCKYRACSEPTKYKNKRLSSSAYSTKTLLSKPTVLLGLLRLSNDFWLIVEVLYPRKIALASLVASLLITAGSCFNWKSSKSCIYSICLASTTACWDTWGLAGERSRALRCWRAKARYFFSDAVWTKTKIYWTRIIQVDTNIC